jgi:uncharacterized protein
MPADAAQRTDDRRVVVAGPREVCAMHRTMRGRALVAMWAGAVVVRLACPWPRGAVWGSAQSLLLFAIAIPLWAAMALSSGAPKRAGVAAATTCAFVAAAMTVESLPDRSTFGIAGHACALLFAVVAIAWVGEGRWRDFGLGLDLRDLATARSLVVIVALVLLLFAGELGLLLARVMSPSSLGAPRGSLLESAIFQFVVVAIEEELVWRGFVQTTVDELLPRTRRVLGAQLGWGAVVSTVLFSLQHMVDLRLDHPSVSFHMHGAFLNAILFAYLRGLTRSVWPGVVLHGLWNGHNAVVRAIAATMS